jgi:hypothetical protein
MPPTDYDTHTNDEHTFNFNGAARRHAILSAGQRALGLPLSARSNAIPVVVVAGKQPPKLEGEAGGHYTKGGTPVRHPSAYSRKGWSSLEYRSSTERVVVGRDWRPW